MTRVIAARVLRTIAERLHPTVDVDLVAVLQQLAGVGARGNGISGPRADVFPSDCGDLAARADMPPLLPCTVCNSALAYLPAIRRAHWPALCAQLGHGPIVGERCPLHRHPLSEQHG